MLLGGSAMVAVGLALWLYGVNSGANPRWVDWPSGAPSWLYEATPNFESELGMLVALLGVARVAASVALIAECKCPTLARRALDSLTAMLRRGAAGTV